MRVIDNILKSFDRWRDVKRPSEPEADLDAKRNVCRFCGTESAHLTRSEEPTCLVCGKTDAHSATPKH